MPDHPPPEQPDVTMDFPSDPSAPRRARRALAPILRDGGRFADDVTLATSEMVSNVSEHTTHGGRLDAWDGNPLVVHVEDFDTSPPSPAGEPTAHGGRGLSIIDHIAHEWGVSPTPTGKIVWATFQRPRHVE